MIKVKSFRADRHPRECKTFIEEHMNVLKAFGFANISSVNSDWAFSPSSFIITFRNKDSNDMIAGGRLQMADGILKLPIEEAVGEFDSSIYQTINSDRIKHGTVEICGLWNTRKAARIGMGSLFIMRVLLAVCSQLGIKSMFSLCAPTTVDSAKKIGGIVMKEIGNNGTFYYPKLNCITTAIKFPDIHTLEHAEKEERDFIFNIRNNWESIISTPLRNNMVEMEYSLIIDEKVNSDV